jgi:hypothetical protein
MKEELLNQVRTQLVRLHVWAKYGAKITKQGGYMDPQWIPVLRAKSEDLLNPADRLKLDIDILNAANPVMPQTKLEVERDIVKTRGWEVDLPTQEQFMADLKKKQAEAEKAQKVQNQPQPSQDKAMGPPSPPSEDKQKARLESGVNKNTTGGTPRMPDRGTSRVPAEVAESLARMGVTFPIVNSDEMDVPSDVKEGATFEVPSPIPDRRITIVIQKLRGFVAGYNDDLSRIYIDPEIALVDMKPIISREIFEYGLERILNLSYEESEDMADVWEKYVCEQIGVGWSVHQSRFRKALRIVNTRKEKVENPSDIIRFAKPKKATSDVKYKRKGVEETKPQEPAKVDITIKTEPIKTEPQEIKIINETKPTETKVDVTVKAEPIKTEKQEVEIKLKEEEDEEKKQDEKEIRKKKKEILEKMGKKLEEDE